MQIAAFIGDEDLDALAGLIQPAGAGARGGDALLEDLKSFFQIEISGFQAADAIFQLLQRFFKRWFTHR